jgi:hypothetical protein
MSRRVSLLTAFSFLIALLSIAPRPADAQTSGDCALIDVTVSAAISNDPGFVGYYKYTVSGTWDVTRLGLSHLDIFIEMQECACKCDGSLFKFNAPAGTSNGLNSSVGLCTVQYEGEYLCRQDPSIPDEFASPTVKFDATGACEPLTVGSGTWYFYSLFPPSPFSVYADAVAIKHGRGTCTGDLRGTLPVCDCSVPAESRTWGQMKVLYR